MNKPINKKLLSWIIATPAIFTVLTIYSFRQPYIPSNNYLNFVIYGLFPSLFIFLFYMIFIKKIKKSGLTSWQLQLKDINTAFDKIKKGVATLIAIPIFSAIMTWTVHSYVVWPLKLLSGQSVKYQLVVVENTPLKKTMSGLTKLILQDQSNTLTNTLRWSTKNSSSYQQGDKLTLTGKKTWFGVIVDAVVKEGI